MNNILPTDTNNCQTLVDQHRFLTDIASRPVRTSVTLLFRARDEANSVVGGLFEAVDCEDSTHVGIGQGGGTDDLKFLFLHMNR